jgi:hypothetical protein
MSLWQLVGLTGRTIVATSLHRRDDIYLPTVYPTWPTIKEEPAVVSARNQRRKDLFWAFYSLDRLTMFTLNRPASIKDEDIDVDVSLSGSSVGLFVYLLTIPSCLL